jgi:hypothetical protein
MHVNEFGILERHLLKARVANGQNESARRSGKIRIRNPSKLL